MKENVTCLGLIVGVLGIMLGLVAVIVAATKAFPMLAVPLVPIYLYVYYIEIRKILKRRAFASDIFDGKYHLITSVRLYLTKLILLGLGFNFMIAGLANISDIAAIVMMMPAMLIGMYRFFEIGEDIKSDVMAHMYQD